MSEKEKELLAGENKPTSRRNEEEEKRAKRKKRDLWIKIVLCLCVVLCVVLTVFESNFFYRGLKAIKVNDTEYSVAEYNWLYTNSYYELYNSLYNTYGSYASYIIDTTKPLKDQKYSDDQTWADYLKEYTDESFKTMTALYDEAKANGYEMGEEYYKNIDSEWAAIEATAKNYGTDTASFLVSSYGKGVNEKVYKEMYERYLYAYSYADSVREGFEISSEDIDARYNEDKKAFDAVTYNYYYISGIAAEDQTDEEAMAAAKEKAEAVLAADDMDAYISENYDANLTEVRYSSYANVSSTYSDWLFDDARVAGDKDVFEATGGYYVIEFVEKNDIHYNTVSVRHILVQPEDKNSDESWDAALEKAEGYVDTWNELGGGEDNFGYIAMAYSSDQGSASNGGLYSNIAKGEMVKEFEDWCFDPARKAGDTDIVKTSYGYHIMYFVEEGEEYYTYAIDSTIRSERYSDYIDALIADYSVENAAGRSSVGKHI